MANYKGNGTQHFDKAEFLKELENFGTLSSFTCFFDGRNFLLTGYDLIEEGICAIFENTEGDTLQFSNLLCGYVGHGPENTVQALSAIGIPADEAEEYCSHRGIQITFGNNSSPGHYTVKEAAHKIWFDPFNNKKSGIYISPRSASFSLKNRAVIYFKPEEEFVDLLRTVSLSDPYSFAYSTIPDSPLKDETELIGTETFPSLPVMRNAEDMGVNLIIFGTRYDTYCCISEKNLIATLNSIYLYLTGKNLFREQRVMGIPFYVDRSWGAATFWKKIKLLLSKRPIQERGELSIQREPGVSL